MTNMREENRVELEPGVYLYLSRMIAEFGKISENLFPCVEMPIECQPLVDGRAIQYEQIIEAGYIGLRQICTFLDKAASASLKEKRIVTCAMVRDKAVEALSQVSDAELRWSYQQFLQREPAEVIA